MDKIYEFLDRSISAESFTINEPFFPELKQLINIRKIDFKKVKNKFVKGYKHIIVERLKNYAKIRIDRMIRYNRKRIDYEN